jgi:hypothetical protein
MVSEVGLNGFCRNEANCSLGRSEVGYKTSVLSVALMVPIVACCCSALLVVLRLTLVRSSCAIAFA